MITAFTLIVLVLAIIIVFLVYLQAGRAKTMGQTIVGTNDLDLFTEKKSRSTDKFLLVLTSVLVALYLIFAFVVFCL